MSYQTIFLKLGSFSLVSNFALIMLLTLLDPYFFLSSHMLKNGTLFYWLWMHAMLSLGILLALLSYETLRVKFQRFLLAYAYISHSIGLLIVGKKLASSFLLYLALLSSIGAGLYLLSLWLDAGKK